MTDPTNDIAMRKLRRQMASEAKYYHGLADIFDSALAAIDPALPEEEQQAALLAAKAKLTALKAAIGPAPVAA